MSWYAKMFKSQEVARERNRREQRRVQEDRHGAPFIQQFRMAELDKEKREIERELERIRKGIHRRPNHSSETTNNNNHKSNTHVSSIFNPRQNRPSDLSGSVSIEPEYSKDENVLYGTILFLQNNPSALVPILTAHAQSDAYLETLERISPRLSANPKQDAFVPNYLKQKEDVSGTEKAFLMKKYSALLHRHSPLLRKGSPLTNRGRNTPRSHKDSPLLGTPGSPHRHLDTSTLPSNTGDVDNPDGAEAMTMNIDLEDLKHDNVATPSPRYTRKPDFATLAADGMTSARENVSRRMSYKDGALGGDLTNSSHEQPPTSASSDTKLDKRPKATKAVAMFPTYDPEVYNPDGTLRTMHQMPSFDKSWEQAQKARYIRSKAALERDRELSVNEIFDKK